MFCVADLSFLVSAIDHRPFVHAEATKLGRTFVDRLTKAERHFQAVVRAGFHRARIERGSLRVMAIIAMLIGRLLIGPDEGETVLRVPGLQLGRFDPIVNEEKVVYGMKGSARTSPAVGLRPLRRTLGLALRIDTPYLLRECLAVYRRRLHHFVFHEFVG